MTSRPYTRLRSLFAMVCLLAVALLYAPFGAAAWAVYAKACCTSRVQCPIHGHHKTQASANSEHAMHCAHEMAGMAQCSMSCCQNPDRPAVAPALFVLSAPVTVSVAATFEPVAALSDLQNVFNSSEPPFLPPRFSTLAASTAAF